MILWSLFWWCNIYNVLPLFMFHDLYTFISWRTLNLTSDQAKLCTPVCDDKLHFGSLSCHLMHTIMPHSIDILWLMFIILKPASWWHWRSMRRFNSCWCIWFSDNIRELIWLCENIIIVKTALVSTHFRLIVLCTYPLFYCYSSYIYDILDLIQSYYISYMILIQL